MEAHPGITVRPSRDQDVEDMLAIYRHHIRRGIEEGVDDGDMPEPDDLRDRRKNLRTRRYPISSPSSTGGWSAMPMWCCSASGPPIATR